MSWSVRRAIGFVLPATAAATVLFAIGATVFHKRAERELVELELSVEDLQLSLEGLREKGVEPVVSKSSGRLLRTPDVTGTLRDLETAALESNVELTMLRMLPVGTGHRRSFVLRGHGSPSSVCSLVATIENHARLMIVEDGAIQAADDVELEFGMTVSTFLEPEAGR